MKFRTGTLAIVLVPLLLGACAEAQLVIHGAKEIAGTSDGKVAKTQGDYKIGNPYRILGTWYYPAENFQYVENGIASWYGTKFHGKRTANGETFDMNELTAAHRTLPMPSMVRVVNLNNGRSLMIRVNDRGPFARGRIIDVSRRAAQLLGFQNQGTARVRVEIVPDDSRRLKYLALNGKLPPEDRIRTGQVVKKAVSVQALPAASPGSERIVKSGTVTAASLDASAPAHPETELFVQAGAFSDRTNATRVKTILSRYGPAQMMETILGKRRLYRVRVGPIEDLGSADVTLGKVIGAGFPNAHIVVE